MDIFRFGKMTPVSSVDDKSKSFLTNFVVVRDTLFVFTRIRFVNQLLPTLADVRPITEKWYIK